MGYHSNLVKVVLSIYEAIRRTPPFSLDVCVIVESANQMIELAFNFQVSRVNMKLSKIPEYQSTVIGLLKNWLVTFQHVIFGLLP